ncbi:MAG: DHH family phosphoesterase [Candidatus Aenigmatarchaeota archaeon]
MKGVRHVDRVLLVHHNDVDGYCAAALLLAAMESLKIRNVDSSVAEVDSLKSLLSKIATAGFDKIIIVDIDAAMLKEDLEGTGADVLIIDHHMVRSDLNSSRITYINPKIFNDEVYQPASYVAYKFLSSFVDISGKEWLAALGTVGDFGFDDCRDLVDKYIDAKSKDDVPKTGFWSVSKVLFGAIIVAAAGRDGITREGIMDILSRAKGADDVSTNKSLNDANKMFEGEHAAAKKAFWKSVETKGNVIIGTIDSPFKRLGSVISTDASIEHKDKVILILERRGDYFKVHARYQLGGMHMGKLMKRCCNGGGHRNAAGGSIAVDEFEHFKTCVFRELGL